MNFSPETIAEVETLYRDNPGLDRIHSKGWKTLERDLQAWEEFVKRTDTGYNSSIYDYTNELSRRSSIEKTNQFISKAASEEITNYVITLDRAFLAATDKVQVPLLPSLGNEPEPGWWWYRIPKILLPELKDDLRSRGLVI
jgi:hypothetical protein